MLERRKFVRISEDSQVSYELISNAKVGDFIAKDISLRGVRFFVHECIPKDSLLKIRLTLKKISFSFEAMVRVIWIREDSRNDRYEVGVEFINMPEEAKKNLMVYIKDILEPAK